MIRQITSALFCLVLWTNLLATAQIFLPSYQGIYNNKSGGPAPAASDDFNGSAAGGSLESRGNWAKVHTYGDMQTWCSGSECVAVSSDGGGSEPIYSWTGSAFANDQWAEATIVKGSNANNYWDRSGVAVRITGYNAYTCTASMDTLYIHYFHGYITVLKQTPVTVSGGETLRCEVSGNQIKATLGATTLTATDSNIVSGAAGAAAANSSGWGRWGADNWRAGSL